MRSLNLIALFSLFISSAVFSQGVVNTEKLIGDSENKFQLLLSPSIDLQKGNSDVMEFSYSFSSLYKVTKKHWLKATGGSDMIKEDGEDITNDNFFQLRHTYSLNDWSHSFAFFQLQNSFSLGIKQRQLLGAGVRFKLKKSEGIKLDLGAGLMNEKEEYRDSSVANQDKIRATTMIIFKTNLSKINFKNITYYQPNLENILDFRVFSEFDMGFSINEWLEYEINYIIRYDNKPVVTGNKTIDHYITSGFNIKLIK